MALTTAAAVRALSSGQAIPSGEDTLLGTLIGRAGPVLAAYCGYPPASATASPTLESASYTRYSGEGVRVSEDCTTLHLEPWPVTAVSSIHDDPEEVYGADTLISSGDYGALRGRRGGDVRLLPTAAHRWSREPFAVKVAFTAGFTSIPADIEQAAIETVLHWWALRQRRGMASIASGEGLQTSYRPEEIPLYIRQLLAPYRLPSVAV